MEVLETVDFAEEYKDIDPCTKSTRAQLDLESNRDNVADPKIVVITAIGKSPYPNTPQKSATLELAVHTPLTYSVSLKAPSIEENSQIPRSSVQYALTLVETGGQGQEAKSVAATRLSIGNTFCFEQLYAGAYSLRIQYEDLAITPPITVDTVSLEWGQAVPDSISVDPKTVGLPAYLPVICSVTFDKAVPEGFGEIRFDLIHPDGQSITQRLSPTGAKIVEVPFGSVPPETYEFTVTLPEGCEFHDHEQTWKYTRPLTVVIGTTADFPVDLPDCECGATVAVAAQVTCSGHQGTEEPPEAWLKPEAESDYVGPKTTTYEEGYFVFSEVPPGAYDGLVVQHPYGWKITNSIPTTNVVRVRGRTPAEGTASDVIAFDCENSGRLDLLVEQADSNSRYLVTLTGPDDMKTLGIIQLQKATFHNVPSGSYMLTVHCLETLTQDLDVAFNGQMSYPVTITDTCATAKTGALKIGFPDPSLVQNYTAVLRIRPDLGHGDIVGKPTGDGFAFDGIPYGDCWQLDILDKDASSEDKPCYSKEINVSKIQDQIELSRQDLGLKPSMAQVTVSLAGMLRGDQRIIHLAREVDRDLQGAYNYQSPANPSARFEVPTGIYRLEVEIPVTYLPPWESDHDPREMSTHFIRLRVAGDYEVTGDKTIVIDWEDMEQRSEPYPAPNLVLPEPLNDEKRPSHAKGRVYLQNAGFRWTCGDSPQQFLLVLQDAEVSEAADSPPIWLQLVDSVTRNDSGEYLANVRTLGSLGMEHECNHRLLWRIEVLESYGSGYILASKACTPREAITYCNW